MKKIITILLSILTVFTVLSTKVLAQTSAGSIEIDNPVEGETYKLYKLVDLQSFASDGASYYYTIKQDDDFFDFLSSGDGKEYVTLTDTSEKVDEKEVYAVSWNEGKNAADFAVATSEYIADRAAGANPISPLKTVKADEGTVKLIFEDLDLGYYFLDSSLGALCSLDTTEPTVIIREKNTKPSVEKKVLRDGTPEASNTASIGDTLTFEVIITAFKGAENYVLYDEASDGITLSATSLTSVKMDDADIGADKYTFTLDDEHNFHIEFTKTFLDTITERKEIKILYTGVLNENALIGNETGNTNSAQLKYGDGNKTVKSTTTTYTYEFEIVKTDADKNIISGAKFNLYKGNELLSFVKDGTTYRYAKADETNTTTSIEAGVATITGLGNGTYSLKETNAPSGYAPLKNAVTVEINGQNNDANYTGTTYIDKGIQIVNKKGGALPDTGEFGTNVILIAGVLAVVSSLIIFNISIRKKHGEK